MSDKIKVIYTVENESIIHDEPDETIYIDFPDTEATHVCHPPKPNDIKDFVRQIVSAYLCGRNDGICYASFAIQNKFDKYAEKATERLLTKHDAYLSFTLKEQP